ncbi:hypothetical protein [Mesorhizobium sp. M2E.F.Ca.ET.209.01.1.1]|uniref:hypothetical protein n=1 Tax=Mesorhizobium sp. M2E.F.Ca.ET.209.01.1.1 TaxID=2500526 RepID=UPI001678639F|nr:hypothetical protein [Mesorhizobium sp. M2E.F.Ca.ET.209.01.1.1]
MYQFLAILTEVVRIATLQWRGEASRGHDCRDHQDSFRRHEPWTDKRPIRRSRR